MSENELWEILGQFGSQIGFEKDPQKRGILPFLRHLGSLCESKKSP